MSIIRNAVAAIGSILLAGGYVLSLAMSFGGDPASYVRALDRSSVPILSLVLLVSAVALALKSEPEEVNP